MLRFMEFPLILQNFLSDWMDEIVQENAEQQISKPELADSLVQVFGSFAAATDSVINEIQSVERDDGAPFHLTIGPDGLRFRSNSDHNIFVDDNLFNLKLGLTEIAMWASAVQQVLRGQYGSINVCLPHLTQGIETFLQTLSDQISLTCVFPVPAPDGAAHENVAVFKIRHNHLVAICEGNSKHIVYFQGQ